MTDRSRARAWLVALVLAVTGCGGGSGSGGGAGTTGEGIDSIAPVDVPAPPTAALKVQANRTTGVPGTTFDLTAQQGGEAASDLTWRFSDGQTASGPTAQVSFAGADVIGVVLTGKDPAGGEVVARTTLVVGEPGGQPPADLTKGISPESGSVGTRLRITSTALADMGAMATLKFGDLSPFEPLRPGPGVALTSIPPAFADASGPIVVKVLVDGVEQETFLVTVQPLPAAPADPQAFVLAATASFADASIAMRKHVSAILTELELPLNTDGARAFATLYRMVERDAVIAHEHLKATIGKADPATVALVARILSAPAAAQARRNLDALTLGVELDRRRVLAATANVNFVDFICKTSNFLQALGKAGQGFDPALNALGFIAFEPPIGVIIAFLKSFKKVIDYAKLFGELFATPEAALDIEKEPDGDSAAFLTVRAVLLSAELCKQAPDKLEDFLVKKLVEQLIKEVSSVDEFAALVKEVDGPAKDIMKVVYGSIEGLTGLKFADEFTKSFQATAEAGFKAALNLAHLDTELQLMCKKLLEFLDLRNKLELEPQKVEFKVVSPPGGGTFTTVGTRTRFQCADSATQSKTPVLVEAAFDCGFAGGSLTRKLSGATTIECGQATSPSPCDGAACADCVANKQATGVCAPAVPFGTVELKQAAPPAGSKATFLLQQDDKHKFVFILGTAQIPEDALIPVGTAFVGLNWEIGGEVKGWKATEGAVRLFKKDGRLCIDLVGPPGKSTITFQKQCDTCAPVEFLEVDITGVVR